VAVPIEMPPLANAAPPRAIPVAAVVDPAAEAVWSRQIGELFNQWGGRVPRTDVVLPPSDPAGDPPDGPAGDARAGAAASRTALPASTSPPAPAAAHAEDAAAEILIPAGRGVYAHPILALSSDQGSPVVMQADSGPIAGDRMIGSFARQGDRLVIHIGTILHDGQNLTADGVVIAPDTMEAAVASDVDQHYLTRFIPPAAAAFVQGLGQALATTSNTATVLSPLGGASFATTLKLPQQLGVAAGVAAGQVANTINEAAPKGPTVSLEANVSVGVMFLSNVTLRR
jgi:intracellular multiplication protein IcmE